MQYWNGLQQWWRRNEATLHVTVCSRLKEEAQGRGRLIATQRIASHRIAAHKEVILKTNHMIAVEVRVRVR
jgi:hypothetical protein